MKSRKLFFIILIFTTVMSLVACSKEINSSKLLRKEGVIPYQLSEKEKYILQAFGMEGNSQIISFHAPKEAITLNVNVYRLEDGKNWSSIGGGGVSIGIDREPTEQLNGVFTMQLKENYVVDFNINASGRASYKTEEIILDLETMSSTKDFLQEFRKIEINKEIPVALMVYDSGRSMRNYSLQDYFDPSKFYGMDLVQVVTLTFTDKELTNS
ncbi:hypothetical protein SAMN02745784_03154 [Tissierella praeacuta DSM 18095]|uniref:Lipoprotein n=1 Tax=Tissierella praeacuta DSM 18095 TaxID=1123404 RepID=A0A1M4ZRI5_9FIRM|nr:hypothetical protein [Tissierella praeacuta]TCU64707.1 hypothetical protein EV204_1226 [Tissierella praeacuta]SHF20402.1 hypothetical protein SAMN02745784_03154 [Tissierella praeacuta DSM 18095]SUP01882.1 Uncharacterised protein [Tissierella praeacuta]